jgi:hypothetical protein
MKLRSWELFNFFLVKTIWSLKIADKFMKFEMQILETGSDGKKKYPNKRYNFIVDNFYVWILLRPPTN